VESWKLARSGLSQIVLVIVGAIIASGAFFVYKSTAQSAGNGFSVSPTRIVIGSDKAKPGSTVKTEEITVTNVTSQTVTAQVDARDFVAGDNEDGTPVVVIDDQQQPSTTIKDYIEPVDPFTLEPNESKSIEVKINIPANATPGSHYGAILFTAQNGGSDDNVALSASVGPIVLMEVDGDLETDLQLVEASAAKDGDDDPTTPSDLGSYFTGGPLSVVLRLQNNGNTFLQPSGTIQVKNMFGGVVDDFELNSPDNAATERDYVLPDQIRRFEDKLSDKLYFGRYTIEGTVSYIGGSGDLIQVNQSFWVVPYWLLAIIAVVIALIVMLPKMFKGYNRRVINKSRRG